MFTGLVETTGVIRRRAKDLLLIQPEKPFADVRVGESISVDGVCLTVDRVRERELSFRLIPETARVSTLGRRRAGSRVNLERALKVGDRLGGHLLLGHVDGQGGLSRRSETGGAVTLEIRVPASLAAGLVPKGPIAVDGVSLTLDPRVGKDRFRVHLVSHTLARTTLGQKKVGEKVNLELDLVLKYLRGML